MILAIYTFQKGMKRFPNLPRLIVAESGDQTARLLLESYLVIIRQAFCGFTISLNRMFAGWFVGEFFGSSEHPKGHSGDKRQDGYGIFHELSPFLLLGHAVTIHFIT